MHLYALRRRRLSCILAPLVGVDRSFAHVHIDLPDSSGNGNGNGGLAVRTVTAVIIDPVHTHTPRAPLVCARACVHTLAVLLFLNERISSREESVTFVRSESITSISIL